MIAFHGTLGTTCKVEDVTDMHGNTVDFIAPGTDCRVALAVYCGIVSALNIVFHMDVGDIYLGFGDLLASRNM